MCLCLALVRNWHVKRTLPKERPDSTDDKGRDWRNRHDRTLNGQEMAEGSDGSGNELGTELGGGRNESWIEVKMGKKARRERKKVWQKGRSSRSEEMKDNEQARGGRGDEEEH